MKLLINGENREFDQLSNLAVLLETLGLKSRSVVVEHNEKVVPRDALEQTGLSAGDKIEIVHFVGGG